MNLQGLQLIPSSMLLGGTSHERRTTSGSNSVQGLFLERTIHEYEEVGSIANVILHLRAAVGHVWFREVYKYPHCWLDRHIQFLQPAEIARATANGSSCHGSVIVFLGSDYATYIRFLDVFSEFGHIPGHNCWSSNVPKIKNVCNSVEERATDT